jgi:hypothetical protein
MTTARKRLIGLADTAAKLWSTQEVLERWHQLFKGTLLTQQFLRYGFRQ